jgi:hypothetical protein
MIKQIVNKAVSGDLKSIKLVHGLLKYWDHPSRRPVCFRKWLAMVDMDHLRDQAAGAAAPRSPLQARISI